MSAVVDEKHQKKTRLCNILWVKKKEDAIMVYFIKKILY
jgi:hypothetical protein